MASKGRFLRNREICSSTTTHTSKIFDKRFAETLQKQWLRGDPKLLQTLLVLQRLPDALPQVKQFQIFVALSQNFHLR